MVCAGANQLTKYNDFMSQLCSDLFDIDNKLADVNSYDKSIMEKVALMETLNDEEKHTIYVMLDAFIGKRKLKDALSGVLNDVK